MGLLITPAQAATGTTSSTEASGKKAFPPFQKEYFASQLVSFAIAFILLYVIVSKLALPRIGDVIATRMGKIEGDLSEAERLKNESDAALKAYEAELAAARASAQAIGSDIRDRLNKQADAERKTLEDRLAAKLAEAEKTIAATRASAMGNVRAIATDAAAAIVQRLAGLSPEAKAIETAVDATLKG